MMPLFGGLPVIDSDRALLPACKILDQKCNSLNLTFHNSTRSTYIILTPQLFLALICGSKVYGNLLFICLSVSLSVYLSSICIYILYAWNQSSIY